MRFLLLIPTKYSYKNILTNALTERGIQSNHYDYRVLFKPLETRIQTHIYKLPYTFRNKWEQYYVGKINRIYKEKIETLNPDAIFIYNNEMLLPQTLEYARAKGIKILFFLGDNPLYTPTNPYNLAVLEYAHAVFVPDTFWQFQLQKTGLQNVQHLLFPLPKNEYYPLDKNEIDKEFQKQHESEVFYAGLNYGNSWGYKKTKFLNEFASFNLKIYGKNTWLRWIAHFPDLEPHFTRVDGYIPTQELNIIYNLTKIIPVDGNPGIFNGIHARVLEALSAGALPLMEWNADMDMIFKGVTDLPAVKDYNAIPEMVSYYLSNEDKRIEKVNEMRDSYNSGFSEEAMVNRILSIVED